MTHQDATPLVQTTAGPGWERPAVSIGGVEALMGASQALLDACQSINTEMLAFWQSRLKDGLATSARLLECTSTDDVLELQLDYAKAALQAHLDQSARLTRLVGQALDEVLSPQPLTKPREARTDASVV